MNPEIQKSNHRFSGQRVKPVHSLADKVFERPGLQEVESFRDLGSDRVLLYSLFAIFLPTYVNKS